MRALALATVSFGPIAKRNGSPKLWNGWPRCCGGEPAAACVPPVAADVSIAPAPAPAPAPVAGAAAAAANAVRRDQRAKGKGKGKGKGLQKPAGAKTKTTGAFDPANKDKSICYGWNCGNACRQTPCGFEHVCWFCEDPTHQGKDCPN